jgi:Uri superfamily endonuclease
VQYCKSNQTRKLSHHTHQLIISDPIYFMKGSYVLLLNLSKDQDIDVGGLGVFRFKKGGYAYVGSAMGKGRCLESRTDRHERLAIEKKGNIRWHIDYLTTNPSSSVVGVLSFAGKDIECKLARMLEDLGCICVAPGFGSSDCKCNTHFFSIDDRKMFEFMRRLPGAFD